MFTPGVDHMRFYKIRQQELLQEAQQSRLVKEALAARPRRGAKILATIGNVLVSFGSSLEARYRPCPQIEVSHQGIGKGC